MGFEVQSLDSELHAGAETNIIIIIII